MMDETETTEVGATTRAAHALRRQLRGIGVTRLYIAPMSQYHDNLMVSDSHWLLPVHRVLPLFGGRYPRPGTYQLAMNDSQPAVARESDFVSQLSLPCDQSSEDMMVIERARFDPPGALLYVSLHDLKDISGTAAPVYSPRPGVFFALHPDYLTFMVGRDDRGWVNRFWIGRPNGDYEPNTPVYVWRTSSAHYIKPREDRAYSTFVGLLMPIRVAED